MEFTVKFRESVYLQVDQHLEVQDDLKVDMCAIQDPLLARRRVSENVAFFDPLIFLRISEGSPLTIQSIADLLREGKAISGRLVSQTCTDPHVIIPCETFYLQDVYVCFDDEADRGHCEKWMVVAIPEGAQTSNSTDLRLHPRAESEYESS